MIFGGPRCYDFSTPIQSTMHVYEVRPRKDKRGFDLISDALPFGRLLYGEPNAIETSQSTETITT